MTELAMTSDVEALLGHTIAASEAERLETLIAMASAVVGPLVDLPEGEVPWVIRYVCASLVVRALSNPGQLSYESVGSYAATFGDAGMALTEGEMALLGPWLTDPDRRNVAYSVHTPRPAETWGIGTAVGFERDLP